MQHSIKKLTESKLEIKVEIPAPDFDQFYDQTLAEFGDNLEMPGFRKGKVPKEIIEKTIEQKETLTRAAEIAIKESYSKIVSENNLEVLGNPEVEILKMALKNPFEFKVKVSIMPEIKLPDYKKIASEMKREKIEVTEKEIEDALKWLQKSRAKFSLKDGLSQKGDWVEIEYSQEGLSSQKDAFVLGQGKLIPGFEDNLEGMKAGEEKEFELDKKKLKTKMISVQKMELPEITDEFVKSLGKFENIVALKQSIEIGIKEEKEILETERIRKDILEKIAQKTEMEIPEILIEEQKKRHLETMKKQVSENLKMNFNQYLEKIKKAEKDILDSFKDISKKQVKESLVLREIENKENIEVSSEEVEKEVNNLLKSSPKEKIDLEGLKSYTKEVIKQEKMFQLLEGLSK